MLGLFAYLASELFIKRNILLPLLVNSSTICLMEPEREPLKSGNSTFDYLREFSLPYAEKAIFP